MVIENFNEYTDLSKLDDYITQGLDLLVVYNRLRNPNIKMDLVGAHFLIGKAIDNSNGNIKFFGHDSITPLEINSNRNIKFFGPDSITLSGVKQHGSPYEITLDNTILMIPTKEIKSNENDGLYQYQFATMYDVKIDNWVTATNPLVGFMKLAEIIPSIKAERERGYTTPVKLERIIDISDKERISIHVEKSRFSIHVSGSTDYKDMHVAGYHKGKGKTTQHTVNQIPVSDSTDYKDMHVAGYRPGKSNSKLR